MWEKGEYKGIRGHEFHLLAGLFHILNDMRKAFNMKNRNEKEND